jgi:D-alanine--poly(phosphoribitol) ligase subunit 1
MHQRLSEGEVQLPDVVDRFLSCAAAQPDAPAVVARGRALSYAALERRVRCFAARLAGLDEPRVLIALPQGADAYAAMLAAGLAGGYYTPLNLAAPFEKLRRIAAQLQPNAIIGGVEIAAALAVEAPQAILIDPRGVSDAERLSGRGRRHELAYVIFTSGSTGMPKGVMIPRHALNHYAAWIGAALAVTPADRLIQHPNIAFDLSILDIYGALCFGASLYPLVDEMDRLMPARMVRRERITIWNSVPSVISLMMQAKQMTAENLASVRLFNFCGEPLLRQQVEAIFGACPGALVQNTYGPTEATVSMTSILLRPGDYAAACGASVALGEPIPGMGLHLVGGPHVDEGEIVITGPQLALGYWGDPTRTAAAFRPVTIEGRTMPGYYTGDWAVRRCGNIFFKERMDFQVKVRGFRIELDEVAEAIRDCGWPVACVLKHGESLAAVVERRDNLTFDEAALRGALAGKIERHAIPEVILEIDRMPRNDNDKLDRKAVAAWLAAAAAHLGPATPP